MNLKVLPLFCSLVLVASAGRFSDMKNAMEDQIKEMMGQFDKSMSQLLSDMKDFGQQMKDVSSCYVPELGGSRMDIFNGSLSFKSIVSDYYKNFPDKSISTSSIQNLLDSSRDMITRCTDSNRGNSSMKFGFTSMSDKSVEEMNEMMGHRPEEEEEDEESSGGQRRVRRLTGDDERCMTPSDESVPEEFDWRDRGVVTPVRNQKSCGSCWTFAATASLESALLINNKTDKSVDELNLSKQQLVQCAKFLGRGCQGGTSEMAFSYLKDNGDSYESDFPYTASNGFCPRWRSLPERVSIQDYCLRTRQRYSLFQPTEELTDRDMEQTLSHFGPLYIAINADPLSSRNYRGGIYDGDCSTQVNHAVTLVGYTRDAWIIKNSWGENWGDGGYFKLAKGTNKCGVRTEMAWPLV